MQLEKKEFLLIVAGMFLGAFTDLVASLLATPSQFALPIVTYFSIVMIGILVAIWGLLEGH